VTADIYGYLIAGADIRYVDQLDVPTRADSQTDANQTQTPHHEGKDIPVEVVGSIGGGGWTRT